MQAIELALGDKAIAAGQFKEADGSFGRDSFFGKGLEFVFERSVDVMPEYYAPLLEFLEGFRKPVFKLLNRIFLRHTRTTLSQIMTNR